MSVQSVLIDFSLDSARLADESGQKSVFEQLQTMLKEYIPNLLLAAEISLDGGSLKILTGTKGVTVSIRLFDRGLVTINVEYYKDDSEDPLITFKTERTPFVTFQCYRLTLLPLIKRGYKYDIYLTSSDERLLEYDIDATLFDEVSPFQRVQIVHSKILGNMLVLDDLQNISEADLVYTETLMQRGKESYEGKEIVILGGGDGALLYELLKENPRYVWMLEIDEMVMKACNKHLNSICGDVLERRKGSNYEIIVEDCMLTVKKFIMENKKVDYIFGDLTDIPISDAPCGELWEFMINILNSAFKILKPTGKFMTHGNGATSSDSLEMYEQVLMKMKPSVTFSKTKAFVPSFYEDWIFYQIGFTQE
ncbi:unnamed protein product [Pieris macdunnoughi]|uniref:PABS domain-containing protein n=1 Tax=Pieris macdunnoughi TaxID=345717 RepID=A0A821VCD3_9NEOP|nr:unnamed protein product [Pieris macdunnoughi]